MPDITMCNAKCKVGPCPIKDMCCRYTAEPSDRQSYFAMAPGHLQQGEKWTCIYFVVNGLDKGA